MRDKGNGVGFGSVLISFFWSNGTVGGTVRRTDGCAVLFRWTFRKVAADINWREELKVIVILKTEEVMQDIFVRIVYMALY